MFGKAFLLYVFSRFSTLLSPHETLTDPSAQIRAYDFSLALSRFSLSPAFGRAEMDILTRWIEGSALFFVDNSFINVLWKMGLFGFVVYILMLSYSLYIVIRGVLMKYDLAILYTTTFHLPYHTLPHHILINILHTHSGFDGVRGGDIKEVKRSIQLSSYILKLSESKLQAS